MTFSCRSVLRAGGCTERAAPACVKAHCAPGVLALLATFAIAASALAANDKPRPSPQTSPEAPSADFQEHGPGMAEVHGIVTPQRITKEIEGEARKEQDPSDFYSTYYMFWAESASEYAALAHYSLLILTVAAQEGQSLPLRNVYIRTLDQRLPLAKLGSWRVSVDPGLASYRITDPIARMPSICFHLPHCFAKARCRWISRPAAPDSRCWKCRRSGSPPSCGGLAVATRRRERCPICGRCRRLSGGTRAAFPSPMRCRLHPSSRRRASISRRRPPC